MTSKPTAGLMKTGLKDKFGHEIETGDLVEVFEIAISDPAFPLQKINRGADVVQSAFIGIVRFDEEGHCFELQTLAGDRIIGINRHTQTYEIIGGEPTARERVIEVNPAWFDDLESYLQADERFFSIQRGGDELEFLTMNGKKIIFKRMAEGKINHGGLNA
jgi:hypothetical protein